MPYDTRPLAELSSFISRGVTPSYTEEGGMLVLNQKCVRNQMVAPEEGRRTDTERRAVSPQKQLRQFDVLVNSTGVGTLGRTAQVKELPEPMTADSHITIVRPTQDIYPLFLGYALQWREPQIEALAEGSTGQTELSRTRLGGEITIPVPTMEVQQKIAEALESLDYKIRLNIRQSRNLEQQLEALFRHWFVDFIPFRDGAIAETEFGPLPEDWKVVPVGHLPVYITDFVANGSFASLKKNVTHCDKAEGGYARFIRNVDLKANEFGKYVDKHSYEYLAKSKLYGGELLISNVGDVGSVYICPYLGGPMTLGNNMIMLHTTGDVYLNYYLYLLFKSTRGRKMIESITGGSVQMKFNKTDFRALRVVMPSERALAQFNSAVRSMFDLKETNRSQTQLLMQTRNTLLPRLMSGEIQLT